MRLLAVAVATVFVRGSAAPVTPLRFAPVMGWHVGHGPVHACPGVKASRCSQVGSWAATTRWHDCAECVPPHRTLTALGRGGIAISVLVGSDGTTGRRKFGWPPHLRARDARRPIDGGPPNVGVDTRVGVLNGFKTYVYVFYGRRRPTPAQVSRANAELRTARLPGT